MPCVVLYLFFFTKINILKNKLSGISSECQVVWIEIRPYVLSNVISRRRKKVKRYIFYQLKMNTTVRKIKPTYLIYYLSFNSYHGEPRYDILKKTENYKFRSNCFCEVSRSDCPLLSTLLMKLLIDIRNMREHFGTPDCMGLFQEHLLSIVTIWVLLDK